MVRPSPKTGSGASWGVGGDKTSHSKRVRARAGGCDVQKRVAERVAVHVVILHERLEGLQQDVFVCQTCSTNGCVDVLAAFSGLSGNVPLFGGGFDVHGGHLYSGVDVSLATRENTSPTRDSSLLRELFHADPSPESAHV